MIPRPLATAIIIVVTLVWAVNFAAQFIFEDYSPDVAIHGIFMAVVGGAMALSRRDNRKDPVSEADEDPDVADDAAKAE